MLLALLPLPQLGGGHVFTLVCLFVMVGLS